MVSPTETAILSERIERLERRFRHTVWLVGIGAIILTASAFRQATPDLTPGVVEATEFQLVDGSGELTAMLSGRFGGPQLVLLSGSGAMASLTPQVFTMSRTDAPTSGMTDFMLPISADTTAAGIRIAGAHGEMRFMSYGGAPRLELYDANENARIILGRAELTLPARDSREITSDGSLLLLDADGNVVWRAP